MSRPRNRSRITLDGTNEQLQYSWSHGIHDLRLYCYLRGHVVDTSSIFGPGHEVYTTGVDGTFYMEFEYKNRLIEIPIMARNLYVRGWKSSKGTYELEFDDQTENYLLDAREKLDFGVNYYDLFSTDIGNAYTGKYPLIHAFEALWSYKGGKPKGLRESMGTIALHISEATRIQAVYTYINESFVNLEFSFLDKITNLSIWIRKYSKISENIMEIVHCLLEGLPVPKLIQFEGLKVSCISEYVCQVRVLHLDAFSPESGQFAHGPPPKLPVFERPFDDITEEMRGLTKRQRKRYLSEQKKGKNPQGRGRRGESGGGGIGRAPPGFPSLVLNWNPQLTQRVHFSSMTHTSEKLRFNYGYGENQKTNKNCLDWFEHYRGKKTWDGIGGGPKGGGGGLVRDPPAFPSFVLDWKTQPVKQVKFGSLTQPEGGGGGVIRGPPAFPSLILDWKAQASQQVKFRPLTHTFKSVIGNGGTGVAEPKPVMNFTNGRGKPSVGGRDGPESGVVGGPVHYFSSAVVTLRTSLLERRYISRIVRYLL